MRRILLLMLPAIAALAVYQINIAALRLFTSYLGEGALTYLYNADRFLQLPLGVFAIAIATASLPAFSDAHSNNDRAGLIHAFGSSVRLTTFITVPAAVGQIALALPIIATVFQHGRFGPAMAENTAKALIAFNIGLVAISGIRVAGQVFFAIKDTRTPVACGAIGLFLNLAMAPILASAMGFVGLALSVSLSAWGQLGVQLFFLRRRVGRVGLRRILVALIRDTVAAAVMGVAAYGMSLELGNWHAGTTLLNVLVLGAIVAVGCAIYAGIQWLFRAPEMTLLMGALKRRLDNRPKVV